MLCFGGGSGVLPGNESLARRDRPALQALEASQWRHTVGCLASSTPTAATATACPQPHFRKPFATFGAATGRSFFSPPVSIILQTQHTSTHIPSPSPSLQDLTLGHHCCPAMAHRAWSLRYTAAKFQLAVDEIALSLQKAASLPQAVEAGLAAYRRSLTSVLFLTGAAMAPTLNPPKAADSVERLLVRLIPRPSAASVFTGDVVAFTSPLASPGASPLDSAMVRRVAAVEGDEMESEDPDVEGFTLPKVGGRVAGVKWAAAARSAPPSHRSRGLVPPPSLWLRRSPAEQCLAVSRHASLLGAGHGVGAGGQRGARAAPRHRLPHLWPAPPRRRPRPLRLLLPLRGRPRWVRAAGRGDWLLCPGSALALGRGSPEGWRLLRN